VVTLQPLPLVMVIGPLVAAAGITTTSDVAVVAAVLVVLPPVKATVLVVPAVKFVPVIVIVDPRQPADGSTAVGNGFTV
jgi:hypothetical protein